MKLVFLSSSDLHGYVLPTDYQNKQKYEDPYGLSRVSSVFKNEKARYGEQNVVLTDAGDFLQGSPLASYVHSVQDDAAFKKFIELDNALGYDARCLGNHDFDFGLDYLAHYFDQSKAPTLNDNILHSKENRPAFGLESLITEKSGVKVGLLGVTTQKVPSWEPAENIAGLRFASAYAQLSYYVQLLRPQVDVLAVIYHGGFEADPVSGEATEPNTGENEGYQILTKIPGIDVFLTGHQHRKLAVVAHQTAIVQPGARGEAVGKVVLEIDDETKKIISKQAMLIETKDYEPDPEIVKLANNLDKSTQKWLDQPIAKLDQPAPITNAMQGRIEGAPFINLLQQMQLYFTKAKISATAVMSETAHGFNEKVTMRDILLNYPFSNQLCRVKVTGKELRAIIEYSLSFLRKDNDGKITFCPEKCEQLFNFDVFYPVKYEAEIARKVGQRLVKLELNGQPINDQEIYSLAVNNYRANGGGFYPAYASAKIDLTLDKDYPQMFEEFLTKLKPKVDITKNYCFY